MLLAGVLNPPVRPSELSTVYVEVCRCDTLGGVQVLIELSEAAAARFVYYLGLSIAVS